MFGKSEKREYLWVCWFIGIIFIKDINILWSLCYFLILFKVEKSVKWFRRLDNLIF